MKVEKVALAAAVCAALMGTQAVLAEKQPLRMGFAFDSAEVSSVEMLELSGAEMEETVGAFSWPFPLEVFSPMPVFPSSWENWANGSNSASPNWFWGE